VSIFPGTKKVSVTGNAYGVPFNVVYDIVIDSKHVDNDNPLINYITTLPFNIGNDGFDQKIERGTKYECTIRKNATPI